MKQKRSFWKNRFVTPGKLRDAMELYPGKTREEVRELLFRELTKRLWPGIFAGAGLLLLAVFTGGEESGEEIVRPAPGGAAATVRVLLELDGGWTTVPLSIGALEYSEEEIEALHETAEKQLETMVPGENESFAKVTKALNFPEKLLEICTGISWSTDAPWLVTSDGEVLNGELTEPVELQITAEVSYGTQVRYFSRPITVCPPEYTEEEMALRTAQQELIAWEESSRTKAQLVLPEHAGGLRVKQSEDTDFGAEGFLILLAFAVPMLLYSGYFGGLDTRRKERKEQAESCYTEFITKLSLLLAAGVSLRRAFERLAEEYEKNHGPEHVLAAELKVTRQELDNGCSETVAYEEFGRRIGVLAYRRMASLLTQSVSKGVQGMRNLLLQEAKEMMAQEKANIRLKGEQAGTKLLLPMMGLLFLVFAILLVPAFQSF